ncbi:MAG: hypothetical protein JNL39_18535 [Opitutaceae bacterium]|nr:hypothetical protein [Opitutaceae bacterium]
MPRNSEDHRNHPDSDNEQNPRGGAHDWVSRISIAATAATIAPTITASTIAVATIAVAIVT